MKLGEHLLLKMILEEICGFVYLYWQKDKMEKSAPNVRVENNVFSATSFPENLQPAEPLTLRDSSESHEVLQHSRCQRTFAFYSCYWSIMRDFSELLSVKVRDISISCVGMSIFIFEYKNDQFCEGHTSFIARSGKVSCPVAITETIGLLSALNDSTFPVLRRIVSTKKGSHFHKSLGISYTTVRDEFRKYLSPFIDNRLI